MVLTLVSGEGLMEDSIMRWEEAKGSEQGNEFVLDNPFFWDLVQFYKT
jgi:hypothetical protein